MTAQLPCYVAVGSWICLPTGRHWVLVQKVPRESEEFQGILIKIAQPDHRSLAHCSGHTRGSGKAKLGSGDFSVAR